MKDYSSILSQDKIKEIEEEAIEAARKVWEGQVVLPYVHCTECEPDAIKARCVVNVITGEAVCARHWIERRVEKLCEEAVEAGKPQLDLEDFGRV